MITVPRLKKLNASDIKESALEEYEKMEEQGPNQPDYKVMRNYLDLW